MASNSNNHDIHPEFNPNLRIKAEPAFESESSSSVSTTTSDSSIQSLLSNIKTEPGLPTTTRLPSIRAKRDLTLGGNVKFERPKKVYTPNLNVQRLKDREDQSASVKNESSTKKEKGRVRDKGRNERERGRDGRNRGRGRGANNLVQSSGIFSQGLADLPGSRRSGGGCSSYRDRDGSASEREYIPQPKLNLNYKVDKEEEDQNIKMLMRDDFIADSMDVDENNAPLMLPMFNEGKVFKQSNHKVDIDSDDESIKSSKLPNGEAKEPNKIRPAIAPKIAKDTREVLTVTQVLEKNNKTNNYFLLQLPDCLPGLRGTDDDIPPKDPRTKTKEDVEPSKENETESANNYCNLSDLKEGMLGKMQILRSGKVRLVLGDNNLIVELGSTVSFRQDLIAAKINNEEQDLVNLGRVNSTLICAPDWEDLLKIL